MRDRATTFLWRGGRLFLPLVLVTLSCACTGDWAPDDGDRLLALMEAEDARGKGPEGLAPLLEGLGSTEWMIQVVAVRGLGRLEDPALIGEISPLLTSPHPEVRAEAANALGQAVFSAGGDRVADLLLEHLNLEEDPAVRGAVARTLGRLTYGNASGVSEAEEALLEITLEGDEDAPTPALLGTVMGMEALARRNQEHRLSAATLSRLTELVSFGVGERGDVLEGASPGAAPVRRTALATLAGVGALERETVRSALADPDSDVRRVALSVLRRPSRAHLAGRLLEAALEEPVPRVRAQAVLTFAAVSEEEERCAALLQASGDPHPQVALTALDLLEAPCPDRAQQIDALLGFVQVEDAVSPNLWHRGAYALLALARVSQADASEHLPAFARHVSPFARAYAARAAAILGNWETLEFLAQDPDPNVRTAASEGLFRLLDHGADEILLAQLTQEDPQLLLTTAGLLAGTSSPEQATGPLLEAFHRISAQREETARDPRMALLERLDEVGTEEALRALEPYLADYDPVVAARVAEILSWKTGEVREAHPEPLPPLPFPSLADLDRLAQARVILEMEGGGEIQIRLFPHLAPTNAARFARLTESGAFDGLTFHRVVSNFVTQGLSPGANEMAGHGRYTRDELGLQSNWRGTVGVSTRGRDTGDGQIFINLVDNLRLDHDYTIFGEVVSGMEVVDGVVEGQVVSRARVVHP